MNKYIRKDLRNFKPYHSPLKPYDIKMDANESPFPHHEDYTKVMCDFNKNHENIRRYPDTDALELRKKIGEHYGLNEENIVCGVGSDQIIDMIIRVFVPSGGKVLMPTPSFSMYKLSTILNHGVAIEVPLDEEFEYDLDLFKQSIIKEKPALVFLCTPNNPTGCILSREQVVDVIKTCTCPIVVDEAYAEFTGISVTDLVNEYDHLIVTRTFSKAYGLAGLRTGYSVACKEMSDAIYIGKPPYNLASYTQMASLFVLEHSPYYMNLVEVLKSERQRLSDILVKLPFVIKVYNSGTNFILLKVSDETIAKFLEKRLILIRDYPPSGNLASCVRITIGTKEENDKLVEVLKEV